MAKEIKLETYTILVGGLNKQKVEGEIFELDECPNVKWGIRKEAPKEYQITHINSGLLAACGHTKKAAINNLLNIFKAKPEMIEFCQNHPNIDDYIKQQEDKNKKFLETKKLAEEFRQITGIKVPICPITRGVDIVKLDKYIQTPDNVSMSDYLIFKYGKRANEIVEEMIKCI